MSTPPPPDRPTDPIRPTRPVPLVEERVTRPAVDLNVVLLRLEDAIGALRTGLMVVGVIAVAALGGAIYTLLDDDSGATRNGSRSGLASDTRVSRLDDRVDRLSRQVQSARAGAGGGDTAALDARVDAIESTVKTLADRPAAAGNSTQAIQQLSSRIDALSRDVDQLQQEQTTP